MPDHIHVEGVPAYDGDYDLDLSAFKNRELRTIKKVAGVRAGELSDALEAGDTDIIVALAVIAIERSGKTVEVDALWEAEAGKISFVAGEEEVAAGPPAEALAESAN